MRLRTNTLWRIPVFCIVSSWISYYITVYIGGFIFTVQTVGADGITELSVDPLRSALFNGLLFVIILLLGGLWAFRSMTKAEIAVSAAIISIIYLVVALAQLYISSFPLSLSVKLASIQNWTGTLASFLLKLTDNFQFSVLLSNLAPFLFIPFGKKTIEQHNRLRAHLLTTGSCRWCCAIYRQGSLWCGATGEPAFIQKRSVHKRTRRFFRAAWQLRSASLNLSDQSNMVFQLSPVW